MSIIIIHKQIESETLHLPELKPLIGKTVEIVVREAKDAVSGAADWDATMQAARELEDYDFDVAQAQRDYDKTHANDHLP